MALKQILFLIVSISLNFSLAGEKRGGGSFRELLLDQGVAPSFLKSIPQHTKPEPQYFKEFCQSGAEGIKKLAQLVTFSTQILSDKLNDICTQPDKLIIRKSLMDELGHILTAVNWPSTSTIAINPDRWDEIENHYNEDLKNILFQSIALHEVASLLGYEHSHNYQWSSLILKGSPLFAQLKTKNDFENAISTQALLFEEDASKYYDKQNERKEGLFAGMITNHLRHQLMSFSPLFDEEIKANVGINYLNEFNTRRAQRGNTYVLGYNPYLIPSILGRIEKKFLSLGMQIRFDLSNKESWSTVVQLHQLLLAVSEQDPSVRAFNNKPYMDVTGYQMVVTEKSTNIFSTELEIDLQRKVMTFNLNTKMDSIANTLKSLYSFVIDHPNPTYIGQESYNMIKFHQVLPEVHIQQSSGKAIIDVFSNPYEYFPLNPTYKETYLISAGGGAPWKTTASGLITAEQIRDRIKKALRGQ